MPRPFPLPAIVLYCGLGCFGWLGFDCFGAAVVAADTTKPSETSKDWTPVTVDGDDVAVVSTNLMPRFTRIRIKVTARGTGHVLRLGEARKADAPISTLTVYTDPDADTTFSELVRTDAFLCLAVGPKDAPMKLEAVEEKDGFTEFRFESGWVVHVTLIPAPHFADQPAAIKNGAVNGGPARAEAAQPAFFFTNATIAGQPSSTALRFAPSLPVC